VVAGFRDILVLSSSRGGQMKIYTIKVPSGFYQTTGRDSYEAFEILLKKITPADIFYLRQFDSVDQILEVL
jgi:hypothetical protein